MVLITYEKYADKLAVIVDIIDHNRVLVQGPGVPRMEINFARCQLTDLSIPIPRAIGVAALERVLAKTDIAALFAKTSWARKIQARKTRQNLSDFDRFKVMLAKKQKRTILGRALKVVRK